MQDKSWDAFKIAAMGIAPASLLTVAKTKANWSSFNWHSTTWSNNDVAEFDLYGHAGGDDPFKGMKGQLIANDSAQSISAIISIKGREGLYSADPVIAVISYKQALYDAKGWSFSQTVQLQSASRFKMSANAILASLTHSLPDVKKQNFFTINWIDANHKTTILQWIEQVPGFADGQIGTNTNDLPDKDVNICVFNDTGADIKIEFNIYNQGSLNKVAYLSYHWTRSAGPVDVGPVGNAFNRTLKAVWK